MIECRECKKEISSTAKSCPSCGAKVPRVKWWLWVPLALFGAFILYGASIPEYESRAVQARNLCEQLAAIEQRHECDRRYSEAIAEGRARNSR